MSCNKTEINIEGDKIYFTDIACHTGYCLDITGLSTDDLIDLKYKCIDELEKRYTQIFKA